MDARLAEVLEGEELAVADWRVARLVALGFSEARAEMLALSDFDIHEFERIVSAGCDFELAVDVIT